MHEILGFAFIRIEHPVGVGEGFDIMKIQVDVAVALADLLQLGSQILINYVVSRQQLIKSRHLRRILLINHSVRLIVWLFRTNFAPETS